MSGVLKTFAFALIVAPAIAHAESTINARLQDSATAAGGATMRIVLDHDRVKAGRTTLRAHNESGHLVHELIVVQIDPKQAELPYDEKSATVVEERIRSLGEISDLAPGASGTLAVNLKPGSYLLICNQPGHYKAGMAARLSVVK
ncbi:MAG: copper resistance protein [Bacillota bacterium]